MSGGRELERKELVRKGKVKGKGVNAGNCGCGIPDDAHLEDWKRGWRGWAQWGRGNSVGKVLKDIVTNFC